MNSILPTRLYKFQPYTAWSVENLKSRSIWFSKPSAFNDPFDCGIILELVDVPPDDWLRLFRLYEREEHPQLRKLSGLPEDALIEMFKAISIPILKRIFERIVLTMRNDRGVACFTEIHDNLIMWSHYADGHRGFCLEFDSPFDPFGKSLHVTYSPRIPTMTPLEVVQSDHAAPTDLGNPILRMITTKSVHWEKEHEWRIFSTAPDHKYQLDAAAITGIYFGCQMVDDAKADIAQIFKGSPTSLFQMSKVDGQFKLQPIQVR